MGGDGVTLAGRCARAAFRAILAGVAALLLFGLALVLAGCAPRAVVTEAPARERAPGWCAAATAKSSEVIEVCTERAATCRRLQRLASDFGGKQLASVEPCRPEPR